MLRNLCVLKLPNSAPWLLALVAICFLVYRPGLSGDFLFDDFSNIVKNPALAAVVRGDPDWLDVAFLNGSGILRRPISMLSFGLNVYWFGMNPFWFKVVNVGIHLANGFLLYLVARRLMEVLAKANIGLARNLALLATAMWMLHPLQVSSVLYVVQRMNLLATTLILAGLICYVEGRQRSLRATNGFALAIGGVCAFGLLAAFCKENGVLIVGYAFVIELFCFHFGGAERDRKRLKAFFLLSIALPLLTLVIYSIRHPAVLFFERNGFTVYTRLLSESRVLCDYLLWIFLPLPSFMGIYHDDIALSKNIVDPITTTLSIIIIFGLIAVGWRLRKRFPAFGFGILWFLIGQSLESTIFPLELVFEHRNYLPVAGLALSAVALTYEQLSWKCTATLGVTVVLILAAITFVRANAWSTGLSLALNDVAHHPLSSRSQYEAGRTILADAAKRGELESATPLVLDYLERSAALDRSAVIAPVAAMLLQGNSGGPSPDKVFDLAYRLKGATSNEQASPFLDLLVATSENKVRLAPKDVATLFHAAMENPRWPPAVRAAILNDYGAYMFNIAQDQQQAISLTMAAAATEPTNPYYELNLAKIALAVDQKDIARHHLEVARALNKIGLYDDEINKVQSALGP